MIGCVRVLVVEDDVRMAAALRRGLRAEAIVVDVAATGEEALRAARTGAFDVVVLDVMLPEVDGFETCRRMRTAGVWVPVICSPRVTLSTTACGGSTRALTTT